MNMRLGFVSVVIACVTTGFVACKDNTVNQTSNTTNNFTSIGTAGGVVTGPDGTRVDVPSGALDTTVNMGILEAADSPALPVTLTPIGKIYAFLPHGQFFLIDSTITMPAPNGQVDIYRAEPGGKWELFAKPKATGGLVKFRTSTFSFYAVAAGSGGCVRDLDCITGQTCSSGACVTGGDAGGDATPVDSGGETSTSCSTPAPSGKSGTVTGSTGMPATDGVATVKSGPDGSEFVQEIRVKIGDFTNMCGYATEGRLKANSRLVFVDLFRRSATSLPPAFEVKSYTIGATTAGGVAESINWASNKLDAACESDSPMPTGTITIEAVTATNVKGRYDITDDGWGSSTPHNGTFDVPICNTTTGVTPCCVN